MSAPFNHEESLFEHALGLDSPQARDDYLRAACGHDAALLERVRTLLAAFGRAGRFLEPTPPGTGAVASPIVSHDENHPVHSPSETPGDRIGRYKLLEPIGEGGMGTVWMAEQEEPVRRRVALKIIKLGMDTREVIARFDAERQALAMMDHPNIAKVFDGGSTEAPLPDPETVQCSRATGAAVGQRPAVLPAGRPYFVMELVRGMPITKYCDDARMSTRDRLELFGHVCRAVQHAHQKGIIHRDLKPSNILVTEQDGRAVPKVIDFGVAKATAGRLTEKTFFTGFAQIIGTPAYMSPEQAGLGSLDIDTRSDTYSLGVVLYELLTGRPPFDTKELMKGGYEAILRTIRETEPLKPSTRLKQEQAARAGSPGTAPIRDSQLEIDPDLDWIVMKCLEKDRNRRYETPTNLLLDLERYLREEPVTARPPSSGYRIRKFVRKHRGAVLVGGGFALLLLAASIVSSGLALWANRERSKAEAAKNAETVQRQTAERERVRAVAAEQGQATARQQAEANEKAARSEAAKSSQVVRVLSDMLGGVAPSVALGRDTTLLREALGRTANRLRRELRDQPEVEAELRLIIGKTYKELGQYTNALAMVKDALRLRKKALGPENPAVAEALDLLAVVYYEQGDLSAAEEVSRESLALNQKLHGADHLAVADALNTLGNVQQTRQDLEGAEKSHREALAIRKKRLGDQHLNVAGTLNNLGNDLAIRGDLAGAEQYYRDALAIFEKRPGHPNLGSALYNVGILTSRKGDLTNAVDLLGRALALREKTLGSDHQEVAVTLNELATVLAAQGELVQAEAAVRRALGVKSLTRDNWRFATTLNTLGIVLSLQGDWAGAETNFHEALVLRQQLLGKKHPTTTETLNRLAILRAVRGEPAEASAQFNETLALKMEAQGARHPDLIPTLLPLSWVLRRQGQTARADSVGREARTLSLEGGPFGVWILIDGMYELADLLQVQKRFSEAEPILKEAIDYLRDPREPNAPFRNGAVERLIRLYDAWGKPEQSIEWRRKLVNERPSPVPISQ